MFGSEERERKRKTTSITGEEEQDQKKKKNLIMAEGTQEQSLTDVFAFFFYLSGFPAQHVCSGLPEKR